MDPQEEAFSNEDWSKRLKEIRDSNKREAEFLLPAIKEKLRSINTVELLPLLTHMAHYVRLDDDIHERSFVQRMREIPVVHFLCALALQMEDDGQAKPNASPRDVYDLIENSISFLFKTSPLIATDRDESENIEKHFLIEGHKQTIKMIRPINPERYPFQTENFITEIDRRVADIFDKKFGLMPRDFFDFGSKIKKYTETALNEKLNEKFESSDPMSFSDKETEYLDNTLLQIETEEEQKNYFDFYCYYTVASYVSGCLVFSASDVVQALSLNDDEAKKLSTFLTLCSNRHGDQLQSSDVLFDNVLLNKPLIQWGDRFFCPAPADLTSALPSTLEKLLENEKLSVPPTRVWDRFQKAKANFVEDKAQEFLARIFSPSNVHKNVIYKFNGNVEEADVLIPYDNKLIIIQAKSGSLNSAARRGAEQSFKNAVKKLVEDAYKQGVKVRDYIQKTPDPVFTLKDGTVVFSPDASTIKKLDYIFINLTLEPLGTLSAKVKDLSAIGFFKAQEYPVSMTIHDLEVISEILPPSPSVFIHYIKERTASHKEGLYHLQDELTAFGYYLNRGSLKRPIGEEFDSVDWIALDTSFIHDFDDYYLRGGAKPALQSHTDWVNLIMQLESIGQPFHTEITERLLSMSRRMQNKIIERIESVFNKKAKKGITGLASLATVAEPVGITFITKDCDRLELNEKLEMLCQLRMYQARKDEWIGLAKARRSNTPWWKISCVQFHENPWSFDPSLEKVETSFIKNEG